jgi:hypothetical protein
MAKPIERFAGLFPRLNIKKGKIISLIENDIPLTEKVWAISMDSYLRVDLPYFTSRENQ